MDDAGTTSLALERGQIEVAAGHEVAVPALLAAYLLIRKLEDEAAATAATVAAT